MSKYLNNANNQNCTGCESKSLLNINCDENLVPDAFEQLFLSSPPTIEENPVPVVVSLNVPAGTTGSLGPIEITIPFGTSGVKVTAWGGGGGGGNGSNNGTNIFVAGGGGGSATKISDYMVIPDLTTTAFVYATIGNGGLSGNPGGNTIINIGNKNLIAYGGGAGGNGNINSGLPGNGGGGGGSNGIGGNGTDGVGGTGGNADPKATSLNYGLYGASGANGGGIPTPGNFEGNISFWVISGSGGGQAGHFFNVNNFSNGATGGNHVLGNLGGMGGGIAGGGGGSGGPGGVGGNGGNINGDVNGQDAPQSSGSGGGGGSAFGIGGQGGSGYALIQFIVQ
ncbi:hypothetical protein Klosneuvirus_1_166 [Klosneuvirus KNV1]|uniref:Uncharacterized protein n=1 Tax=Klosneuvirus KNV1 TaxID=1977640 RepID=A0A1V0SHV4_9VIRU|nr:hypothetical protein Klosneuvirus_1_166 [Klosneuvirus KNV1]